MEGWTYMMPSCEVVPELYNAIDDAVCDESMSMEIRDAMMMTKYQYDARGQRGVAC